MAKRKASKFLHQKTTWISILVTAAALILPMAFFLVPIYDSHQQRQHTYRNVSSILRELVQHATQLETIGWQYKKLLQVDPFSDLVESQVMPVHDKMSSLRRQVRIYEAMERSSAPTQFMEYSFKELNFIEQEIGRFEVQYGQILAATKELASLRRESKHAYEKLSRIIDDETVEILEENGVYFDDPPLKLLKLKLNPNRTVEQVIQIISQVSVMFDKFEAYRSQLKQIVRVHNITDVHQTYGTPVLALMLNLTKCQKEIDGFLETNEEYLRLTFTNLELQLEERRRDETQIVAVQTRFKQRYDRLTEMLADDVFNTRERVKNLWFTSKRKSEL